MRLVRPTALALLALTFLTVPGATKVSGQTDPGGVRRLAILHVISAPNKLTFAFYDELAQRGWVRDKTLLFEERFTPMDRSANLDLVAIARELVASKPDVIATFTTVAVRAVQEVTTTIPIVFGWVSDPDESRLVDSLRRPGGNATGVAMFTMEMNGKRLELLTEMVPRAKRIGVLVNPVDQRTKSAFLGMKDAWSRSRNVQLDAEEVRTPSEIERAIAALARRGVKALMEFPDVMLANNQDLQIRAAARHRLPAIYVSLDAVRRGGLAGLDMNQEAHARHQAAYVDRVLRGGKPSELPVERSTKLEFVINLKTAKALGLTIPRAVLARADEIIE